MPKPQPTKKAEKASKKTGKGEEGAIFHLVYSLVGASASGAPDDKGKQKGKDKEPPTKKRKSGLARSLARERG